MTRYGLIVGLFVLAACKTPEMDVTAVSTPTSTIESIPVEVSRLVVTTEPSPTPAVPSSEPITPPPPPQVNCPDPLVDEMVGTLVKNDLNTIYTNPVLGIELTSPNKLCVHEPDYLSDSYGFSLSDPEAWEGALLSADWLYRATPAQLETHVQQAIDSVPELEVNRKAVVVDGLAGVMLWPLPGTETTTHIYLVANDRLYQLILWSAPLDDLAHMLLDGLRFVEPTQSLDSLDLPAAGSSTFVLPTAVPTHQSAIQSGQPILFIRNNDLWRAGINGQNAQRLTEGEILANWGIDKLPTYDPWWMGGFPPQIHVSPDGRWLAFTQTGRNLVLVDVTGVEPPRIHDLNGWAMIFTWSPDSQSLAYSIQPHFLADNNRSGIFIYDVVDASSHHLLNQNGENLAWSPDGRFLAFSCCFSESQPGPYEGTSKGEVRHVELTTRNVTSVGETWIGVASGSPPICWSADRTVRIEVVELVSCSYERPYPHGISPDGTHQAYLALRSPDDEEHFRLLAVKDVAADVSLWQSEVPLAQKVYWSPDGLQLLLGSDYFAPESAIYRIPADGNGEAQLLLPDALLLDVIAAWQ